MRHPLRHTSVAAVAAIAIFAAGPVAMFHSTTIAFADESEAFDVEGATDADRTFQGRAWTEDGEDGRVAIAVLALDGIDGEQRLQAPAPGDRPLSGIQVKEREAADGAADSLEDLLNEDEDEASGVSFELVPVFGDADPVVEGEGDGEDDGDEPAAPAAPRVEIVWADDGSDVEDGHEVLVGQKVALKVALYGADGAALPAEDVFFVRWHVPGSLIKDYHHDVISEETIWQGRASFEDGEDMHKGQIDTKVVSMLQDDYEKADLSFYWTSEAQGREVRVLVRARTGEVLRASATLNIRRSDIPARELYTAAGMISSNWEVLPNHSQWHFNFSGEDRFILFHREFLRGYNNWRSIFGYLPVEAVTDIEQPGGGLEKPSYLTIEGGEQTSGRHDANKLADFETMTQLGDDLESPWHNRGHMVESSRVVDGARPNSDMGSVLNAPKCEVFFQWHTKVDNVGLEWEWVKANEAAADDDGDDDAEPELANAEILEGSSSIPEAIAEGERVVLRLGGALPAGHELREIKVTKMQLERLPPIDVIQLDAVVAIVDPDADGEAGTFEAEVDLGELAAGEYQIRFNQELGGDAFFMKTYQVGDSSVGLEGDEDAEEEADEEPGDGGEGPGDGGPPPLDSPPVREDDAPAEGAPPGGDGG